MRSSNVALVLLSALMLVQIGCSVTRVNARERVQWLDCAPALGDVAVLVRIDHRRSERDPEAKDLEVREIIQKILAEHTGAAIADETSIQNVLGEAKRWENASEYEIIEAARKAGIDTVGLISFDRYGGDVWVLLLPPGWMTNRYVYYRLRLLDVATGRVVADLSRYRRTSGYLNVTGRKRLPVDLREDLAQALTREPAG